MTARKKRLKNGVNKKVYNVMCELIISRIALCAVSIKSRHCAIGAHKMAMGAAIIRNAFFSPLQSAGCLLHKCGWESIAVF